MSRQEGPRHANESINVRIRKAQRDADASLEDMLKRSLQAPELKRNLRGQIYDTKTGRLVPEGSLPRTSVHTAQDSSAPDISVPTDSDLARRYIDGYEQGQVDSGARTEEEHREAEENAARALSSLCDPLWADGYVDGALGKMMKYTEEA